MYKSIKGYNSKRIRGKLRVNNYLSADASVKRYVPRTVSLTLDNLMKMGKQYRALYIKPDVGSMGIGVYKLVRKENGYVLYSTRKRKQLHRHFLTVSAVYNHLKALQKQKMIIQKAVSLDHVNGRPYDIRAMVQRKPGGSWNCTGFLVKVGAPHKIVTNYYQGGQIYTIEKLLKLKGFSPSSSRARIKYLSGTAVKISQVLSKRKAGMHEMGIDLAYDTKRRLWVLEVNSNHPQFHPLKKLDRTAYNRIMSYCRSYGRHNAY